MQVHSDNLCSLGAAIAAMRLGAATDSYKKGRFDCRHQPPTREVKVDARAKALRAAVGNRMAFPLLVQRAIYVWREEYRQELVQVLLLSAL